MRSVGIDGGNDPSDGRGGNILSGPNALIRMIGRGGIEALRRQAEQVRLIKLGGGTLKSSLDQERRLEYNARALAARTHGPNH